MSQRLGRAFIKVNGGLLESLPGASIDIGGVKRNVVKGNSVHGFAEEAMESMVECELSIDKNSRPHDWAKWADVSITFECDTGQVFVVRNAFLTETPKLTAGEGGKVPLKFAGPPADPVN